MRSSLLVRSLLARLTVWRAILLVILAFGLYATVIRFSQGLGASTGLSDAFPWGLWIGFDVLVGVGLAAGGFVIAAVVHVFRMKKYEAVARPTVLTAFLGYLLVIVALLFDLGRPYRIWHPMVMWNPRSVMFEVAWCVTLYTTVLALEFSPLLFERLKMRRALKVVRNLFVPLVIVGVLLSTLHQSSLGSLYVIVPDKLHGLWYSPLLPVFFFVSAIAAGLAMTIFESFLSYRAFGKRLESDLLRGLGRVMVVVLAVLAVLRLQDLAARGNLALAFRVTPESVLFWGEMGLGILLPMVLMALPAVRRNENGLFFAAVLAILGFITNRLNVAITGMAASSGVSYMPTLLEFAVTASIVGMGFVLFSLAVRYLPVFPEAKDGESVGEARGIERAGVGLAPSRGVLAGLWALLAVGVGTVAYSLGSEELQAETRQAGLVTDGSSRAFELPDLPASYVFPQAEESPGPVAFDHRTHVDPAKPDCGACHASVFSIRQPGTPLQGELEIGRIHQGDLCGSCHDGTRAFSALEECDLCHQ